MSHSKVEVRSATDYMTTVITCIYISYSIFNEFGLSLLMIIITTCAITFIHPTTCTNNNKLRLILRSKIRDS